MIGVFVVPWSLENTSDGQRIVNPIMDEAVAQGVNLRCQHVFPPKTNGIPATLGGQQLFGAVVRDNRLAVLNGIRDLTGVTTLPMKGPVDMPLSRNRFDPERYTRAEWRALRQVILGFGISRNRFQQLARESSRNMNFVVRLLQIINPEYNMPFRFRRTLAGHEFYGG